MINLPWYVLGILITLLVFALLFAVTNGMIDSSKREIVFSGIMFIPFARKKGMEDSILKAVFYALIVALIAFALFQAISPKGLTDIYINTPT